MTIERSTQSGTYAPVLDIRETEGAVKAVKDIFQQRLSRALNLRRVTAPLIVEAGTGLNDDLNGVERPVSFRAPALGETRVEVVQSLAKWKRQALADLGIQPGEGLYTDMNAIRPDEELDNLHSLYVDQWDWERVILEEDRHLETLKDTVKTIFAVIRDTETFVCERYRGIRPELPEEIIFVHAEELAVDYPDLSPPQREGRAASEHGAVFVTGIGAPLGGGEPHDGRAPDYDDWITPNGAGLGLNGDIVVWCRHLGRALELSSMGIRVSPRSLLEQLEIRGCGERRQLEVHRRLLAGRLPFSIGGGIGQSRLCLFLLRKLHIGEVQAAVWPEAMRRACLEEGIPLL